MSQLVFILGKHKCFTSTLVRLLNSSGEIIIGYEKLHRRFKKPITDNDSVQRYIDCLLTELRKFRGDHFTYEGDKIVTPLVYDTYKIIHNYDPNIKFIIPIRDVYSWFLKMYHVCRKCEDGFSDWGYLTTYHKIIVNYVLILLKFYKESITNKNILILDVNRFITDKDWILNSISTFLNVNDIRRDWYNHEPNKCGTPTWLKGHPTANIDTTQFDIDVSITTKDFWKVLSPIFDKYINYVYMNEKVSDDIINYDIEILNKLHAEKLPNNIDFYYNI